MIHDHEEKGGAGVSGLKQSSSIHFHLRLKRSKNKELYSSLPPPDSLANTHTNSGDDINSESPSENRNSNKQNYLYFNTTNNPREGMYIWRVRIFLTVKL